MVSGASLLEPVTANEEPSFQPSLQPLRPKQF